MRQQSSNLYFTYSPFAAIVFSPLTAVGPIIAKSAIFLASIAALFRIGWLISGEKNVNSLLKNWNRSTIVLSFVAVSLVSEPYVSNLNFGQVNLLVLWAVLEDSLRSERRWSGVLLGVAAGIKLIPAMIILLFLIIGRRAEFLRAFTAATATVALGFLFFPLSSWAFWTSIAYNEQRVGGVAYIGNQSINGVLWRLTAPGGKPWLWAFIVILVAVVGLAAARVLWRGGLRLEAVASAGATTLLVSPISWSHHWVWITVFVYVLCNQTWISKRISIASKLAAFLLAAELSWVIWYFPHGGDREYYVPLLHKILGSSYFILCTLMLAWLCTLAVRSSRAGRLEVDEPMAQEMTGTAPIKGSQS